MGTTIKPIETHYKGYRFRSRLEARWAIFFDTLGIEYQYEPEGFELGDGLRYLPDFWLPELRYWIEIKPTREVSEHENRKMERFVHEMRNSNHQDVPRMVNWQQFAVLCGEPYLGSFSIWNPGVEVWVKPRRWFYACAVCGHVHIGDVYDLANDEWQYHCDCCDGGKCRDAHPKWSKYFHKGDIYAPTDPREDPRLLAAFDAARSARFEFGG